MYEECRWFIGPLPFPRGIESRIPALTYLQALSIATLIVYPSARLQATAAVNAVSFKDDQISVPTCEGLQAREQPVP